MKLRNKKTGEIMDDVQYRNYSLSNGFGFRMNGKEWEYHSLAELNEEWEDYEEPKEYWRITDLGEVKSIRLDQHHQNIEKCKLIGNYFGTKEEAEKAVEKLKAWKQLKDKGFRFEGWDNTDRSTIHNFSLFVTIEDLENINKDLDLLFGGEE